MDISNQYDDCVATQSWPSLKSMKTQEWVQNLKYLSQQSCKRRKIPSKQARKVWKGLEGNL